MTDRPAALDSVPLSAWEKLGSKKLYFGHQSVGFNIIEGLKDIMKENPQIKLNIVETSRLQDFDAPLFAHSRVGQNLNPGSKADAFRELIKTGIGEKADMAFFKFCYVDIDEKSDFTAIFNYYKNIMADLTSDYPHTIFIHVTAPLVASPVGFKTTLKRLLNYPVKWTDPGNIKRNGYNKLLLQEYSGKQPVFDLAGIESTFPDGSRCYFRKGGEKIFTLVPAYSNDGAHLNPLGRNHVAEQLLIFLSKLV